MMDTLFRLEMLGALKVRQGSREIRRFRTQKTSSLLAYLAYYKQRSHPRDLLSERLWPASTLEAARTNLSVALSALRRQLEAPGIPVASVLITDRTHVHINPGAFSTDVEEFDAFLNQAEAIFEPEKRLPMLIQALDLYQGELLPGLYEDWILAERDRLRNAYLFALKQVVKVYAESRQYERAIEYAHRMVQADPLREPSYHNLMRLYLAVGRPEEALAQYQALEHLLMKELQAAPSDPLRELAAKLSHLAPVRHPPSEAGASRNRPQEPASLRQSPPVSNQRSVYRIPMQFTRFFGQEATIARLTELLCLDRTRVVTLTGSGGAGKTRLSIEVALCIKEAFVGAWFVPLSELRDPLLLGEVIRDALDLPRQTTPPALDQVIAYLNDLGGAALLILDNCEQIAAGGAPIVWTLLNRVPTLRCLVTSRQPLELAGELEIPIQPLPTPRSRSVSTYEDTTQLLTYPSVALFVDRAQAKRPDFQITPRNAGVIAALCEKLEGIPLAIELAASRAKVMSPAQILDRLTERFELLASRREDKGDRHRSLWAAIDWSYHLLTPDLQRLFARLSVFRGGWWLETAEAICGGGVEDPEEKDLTASIINPMVLDALSQLRGHSLLFVEESSTGLRFRMLETLREFAADQLTSEEREDLEKRHAAYFHRWSMGASLTGPDKTVWFARFEEDLDNLRALLEWALREGNDLELGLQIAGTLCSFWRVRGYFTEGRRWYAALLEHAGESVTIGRGRALYGAGTLATLQGEFAEARTLLDQCLVISRMLGDEATLTKAYIELGSIVYRQGDYVTARLHYEKALSLARDRGKSDHIAIALGNLANIALSLCDFPAAHTLNLETLELWRELGDPFGEAVTLHNLANVAQAQKQLKEARAYLEQCLELKRKIGHRHSLCYTLGNIAEVAIEQGDYAPAVAYAREGLALARELNARSNLVDHLHMLTNLARAIGELEIATRTYAAMERLREELHYPMQPQGQEEYQRMLNDLKEALGADVYETARTEGGHLSMEQAFACLEEMMASNPSLVQTGSPAHMER